MQQLEINILMEPKRPGSLQGSKQQTANYLKRAALQAHGTELPHAARYRIAERKHKPPTTTKILSVLLLATCFGLFKRHRKEIKIGKER